MADDLAVGGSLPDFEDDPFASDELTAAEELMQEVVMEPENDAAQDEGGADEGGEAASEGVEAPIYHPAQVEYGGTSFAGMRVLVAYPQKLSSGFGSYMAYPVSVKKIDEEASSSDDALILRRYSDFLWLRETISKEYYARLIPPMPPKHALGGNMPEEKFLQIRRAALEKFLERLMSHPVLSRSKALDTFLHSKNHELANRKKDVERLMAGRKVDAMVATKSLLKKKTEKNATLTAQVAKYEEIALKLQEAANGLTGDSRVMGNLCADLGAVARTLPEKDDCLRPYLEKFATVLQSEAESVDQMDPVLEPMVSAPFREYALYVDALKATVAKCDAVNAEAEVMQDMLDAERKNKAEIERPNSQNVSMAAVLGKPPAEVQAEKLAESERLIAQLTNAVQSAENEVSVTDANVDADISLFEQQHTADVKFALGTYAATQREHAQRMQGMWKDFIEDMLSME